MARKTSFKVGNVHSNMDIVKEFAVGNMGGMRKSNKYNCLVIVLDHTKKLYEDKWNNDTLYYTGMGKYGDQTLIGNQNKTLFESDLNGVEVHLFEVYTPRSIHIVVSLSCLGNHIR